MSSPTQSAIVIVVDRLGAAWLGPYGNTWVETPYFNQFASESFLCEQAIIDSPNLQRVYRSYWTGQHACLATQPDPTCNLLHSLSERSIPTILVTDESSVAEHPCADSIQSVVLEATDAAGSAESVDDTQIARLFALATKEFRTDPAAARKLISTGQAPPPKGIDTIEHASWTTVARAILNLSETYSRN